MDHWIFDVTGKEIINLKEAKRIYIYETKDYGFVDDFQIRVCHDDGYTIVFFWKTLDEAITYLNKLYERINN